MKSLYILTFLFSSIAFCQDRICRTNILDVVETELSTNTIENYLKYDFSDLWTQSDDEIVYGIIGKEHQRIHIKLITIEKNLNNPNEYLVYESQWLNRIFAIL